MALYVKTERLILFQRINLVVCSEIMQAPIPMNRYIDNPDLFEFNTKVTSIE